MTITSMALQAVKEVGATGWVVDMPDADRDLDDARE